MSPTHARGESDSSGSTTNQYDDAEKGLIDNTPNLPIIPRLARMGKRTSQHIDAMGKRTSQHLDNMGKRTSQHIDNMGKRTSMHIDSFLSPISPVHEGLTPFSSVPELSLSWPEGWKAQEEAATVEKVERVEPRKPAKPKPKVSRWILFVLWFNPYRKFFMFVTLLNLAGIIMAALGRFPYAESHLGALVLGNLLCAVMFRNELFLRCLYIIFIYGLRSVSFSMLLRIFVCVDSMTS